MILSTNQNRQFYVIKSYKSGETAENDITVAGDATLKNGTKELWLIHKGHGGITRSDIIDKSTITYAKLTKASKMQKYGKKADVTLKNDYLVDGKLISGQDYIIRIHINNYLAPGDANTLVKVGAVHATKGMTPQKFYEAMAKSLTKNFEREAGKYLTFTGDATGLHIKTIDDQPWRLGVLSQDVVNFEVFPSTIRVDGDEVVWANDVNIVKGDAIPNGKTVCDMEYYCQAERGDMFRNMGWPNNIDVKYLADPNTEYDLIDIHYSYSGEGTDVHKSEKDITFAMPTSVTSGVKTALTTAGVTLKED